MILYVFLLAGTAVCLVPLYWMFRSSLMSNAEIFVFPPRFFPANWRWNNYVKTFQNFEALMYFILKFSAANLTQDVRIARIVDFKSSTTFWAFDF